MRSDRKSVKPSELRKIELVSINIFIIIVYHVTISNYLYSCIMKFSRINEIIIQKGFIKSNKRAINMKHDSAESVKKIWDFDGARRVVM